MGKPKPTQENQTNQPAGATDLEGAMRHLCMAITNLTSAVERHGQDVSAIITAVRQDAADALDCLGQMPLQLEAGDAPGPSAAVAAAADAANKTDPDNVS